MKLWIILLLPALFVGCQTIEGRKYRGQLEFEKGLRYYNRYDFESAKQCFEWALYLDPNHKEAKAYLEVCRRILVKPEEYECVAGESAFP